MTQKNVFEITIAFRLIMSLLKNELSRSETRSIGGFVWIILTPLGGILFLAFIFQAGLKIRTPGVGDSWMLFFATGLVPFTIYKDAMNRVSRSLAFNKGLLEYPPLTYIHAIVARALFSFLLSCALAVFTFTLIINLENLNVSISLPMIVLSILTAFSIGLSFGLVNCCLSLYGTWRNLWKVLTRPLFLLSCIFYTYAAVPEVGKSIIWYNPIIHAVGFMRQGFYNVYDGYYLSLGYVLILSLIITCTSLIVLYFQNEKIISEI
ncbi:MAG: ABC transporter permease [Paracoccaceae bacterium]